MSVEFPVSESPYRLKFEHLANLLPRAASSQMLTPTAAAVFMAHVTESGSQLTKNSSQLLNPLNEACKAQLEPLSEHPDAYVVTGDELRGIIAKAIHLAAAQTALSLALAVEDVQKLTAITVNDADKQN